MKHQKLMARMARWHIWLAWLAGVPVLMWTVTGLIMTIRPIEEVRGDHLRHEAKPAPLPSEYSGRNADDSEAVTEMRAFMQRGKPVMLLTTVDGATKRVDLASGQVLAPITAIEAAEITRQELREQQAIKAVHFFPADNPPSDFRRPQAVWQVGLEDGTHIYVDQQSGEIAAVRTPFWRAFDFAWGLHIMDLQTREDTHHPILILFASLAATLCLIGAILMFRKRKGFVRKPRLKSSGSAQQTDP